jgi:hypothetical protein
MMNGIEGCGCEEGKEEVKTRPSVWEQLESAATDSFGSIVSPRHGSREFQKKMIRCNIGKKAS